MALCPALMAQVSGLKALDPFLFGDYGKGEYLRSIFGDFMPIYEYSCSHCHELSEVLQKLNEKAPELCPSCQKSGGMEKVVSHSAFHLKGGGWYKDLYSSKKPSEASNEKGAKTEKKCQDKCEPTKKKES